jgi:hypothetical protein
MSDVQIAVVDQQDTQIVLAVPGVQGATGSEIPTGGTADQVLRKSSSTNYDTNWSQVTSAMIADGTIVNADINASAAIAGTKISPDFGSQTVQTTGIFSAAGGSAAAPSIAFTGDTNTGIYSPGADQVAISTAGSGRLFVDASGNVGVNTASPSYQLDINGQTRIAANSTSAQLRLERTGTSSGHSWLGAQSDALLMVLDSSFNEKLRITSAGLVGVGTSSPIAPLHCASNDSSTSIATSSPTAVLQNLNATSGAVNDLLFANSGGFGSAAIYVGQTQTGNSGDNLVLTTKTSGGSWNTGVVVDTAGRVGIGTTSPSYALDVSGQIRAAANATLAQLRLERTGSNTGHSWLGAQSDALLAVLDSSFAEKMRLDSSGRLLVGTSSALTGSTAQYSKNVNLGNSANSAGNAVLAIGRGQAVAGISSGNAVGSIFFTDNAAAEFASIECFADAAPAAGDYPGRLAFSTCASGASSPTERMRISSTGTVSFYYGLSFADRGTTKGISMPDWRVYNSTSNQYVIDNYSVGVKLDNGATAWSTVSDERQKTNLQPIENGLNKVSALRAVTGRYLVDAEDVSRSFLIAQDVQAVLPEAVSVDSDEGSTLGLRYTEVIPLLVAALKESKERIETLEAAVTALQQ